MEHFEPTISAPLAQDEHGTIRVVGSRIPLDTIVHQFKDGASAEQIQEDFPSLTLRQVYGAIAYYLDHVSDVEAYLQTREREAAQIRAKIESDPRLGAMRKRLRELRDRTAK